jgi:hypothetical protein
MTFLRTDSLTWKREDVRYVQVVAKVRSYAYIGNRNSIGHSSISKILHHILDEHGALSNLTIYCSESVCASFGQRMAGCLTDSNLSAIIADEGDLGRLCSHCVYVYGDRNGCRVVVEWMKLCRGKIEVLLVDVGEVVGRKSRKRFRWKIEGVFVLGDDSKTESASELEP